MTQLTCWILHLTIVGDVHGPLQCICCARLCRCLVVASKAILLNGPSLFHISFLLCTPILLRATSTIFSTLFVYLSFYIHSLMPGLLPFHLLWPLVVEVGFSIHSPLVVDGHSNHSSSLTWMPQFSLPFSFNALEYWLQSASAKQFDPSTRINNSNSNMLQ